MSKDPRCGCCEGTEPLTPLATANRPGLDALRTRVGTHASFYETMVARLSSHRLADGRRPLQRLTTRAPDDPALALLDAWATVADVLTFYQERIANEGYLATATERRSILELARLVGYELRPGVAAGVYLAFTLDDGFDVEIPAGTRARSLPGPGELPQAFETAEALEARSVWNVLSPRRTVPSLLQPDAGFEGTRDLYLEGVATGLQTNAALLFVCGSTVQPYTVRTVDPEAAAGRTRVIYAPYVGGTAPDPTPDPVPTPVPRLVEPASSEELAVRGRSLIGGQAEIGDTQTPSPALTRLGGLVAGLRRDPSLQPASRFQLARPLEQTYNGTSDLGPRLLAGFYPRLRDSLYTAYANAAVSASGSGRCRVEAMRVKAAPFGHNAATHEIFVDDGEVTREPWVLAELGDGGSADLLSLDATYEGITPGSRVLVDRADAEPFVASVLEVRTVSRADYGISAKVTRLRLDRDWLTNVDETSLDVLRNTTVYAHSEPLELAEEPIADDVAAGEIELDGLYEGLEAGRWVVVRGERTDVLDAGEQPVAGVEASELAMLAGVEHDVRTVARGEAEIELPTDTLHTRLLLAEPLAYSYRRDTVTIHANVVRATHGETQEEVLGSGDASRALQAFGLGKSPLTHVAAPTPDGVESTLEVRVDEVRWPLQETLLYLDANGRGYVTRTDDDGNTRVIFGDGKRGVRLPTGSENVTAVYRSGIGKGGNVGAGRISSLATRPLGVKEVVNPQRASGGADPESRDQARRNVPLAVLALDRLVAVQDYADFTRTFAGIGKAAAASLSDGRRQVVHLTVAGADDVPIDEASDLSRNLLLALGRFGDPNVALQVALREAVFLFVSAGVAVLEDYRWDEVEPRVRAALLEALGFDRRELGQDVLLSEVIGLVQQVEGVAHVDVDLLDGVSESEAADPETLAAKLESLAAGAGPGPVLAMSKGCAPGFAPGARPKQRLVVEPARIDPTVSDPASRIRPAQLAYLRPDLPDTLVLAEVTS
jgi:predicted phage baseplate assembly protein